MLIIVCALSPYTAHQGRSMHMGLSLKLRNRKCVMVMVMLFWMPNCMSSITTRAYVLQSFKTAIYLIMQLKVQINVNISMFFDLHK